MPFFLYSHEPVGRHRRYCLLKQIRPLAGRGPLVRAIKKGMPSKGPYKWHRSPADIISEMGVDPSNHEIIIDLNPRRDVSLYLLKEVWGYTYEQWTPIAVLLQSLYVDLRHRNPSQFKRVFDDKEAEKELVGEFLYLRGGTKSGTWNWGPVGSVNAPLLWKDSFQYLAGALSKYLG